MIRWLKNLYYRIFYRKTGEDVLGALTNCESYTNYQLAARRAEEKMKEAVKSFISDMDYDIRYAASEGKFSTYKTYDFRKMTRKQKKYLKNLYRERGYRVRTYLWFEFETKFIVSWKHWR